MRNWKRFAALLLTLCTLVSVLAGCSATENKKETLRVSLPTAPAALDPARVVTDTERIVVTHLYENLMKLTRDGTSENTIVANGVARAYKCEENLDGTQTYTFKLREDVRWSDGKGLVAADFVYAWRRLADPDTGSPNAALLNMVAGYDSVRSSGNSDYLQVSAPDDRTFVVTLAHRCTYFIDRICTAAATMPVRSDVAEKENWAADVATLRTNGAYRVTAWNEDGSIVAEAQEHYYDLNRLGPDVLELRFHDDTATAEKRLKDGEADFILGMSDAGVDPKDKDWVANHYPEVGMLVVNQMAGSLASEELRLAMSMVIDRHAVVETMGTLRYCAADGLLPHGITGSNGADIRLSDTNPVLDNFPGHYEAVCRKAKELLGSKKSWDDVVINLAYVEGDTNKAVVDGLVKTWQKQLGVTVTPVAMSAADLDTALRHGDFAMAMVTQHSSLGDADGFLKPWRSGNYANINNNAYDLLLRISDVSSGAVARDAYLLDAERMLLESGYVMPLWFGNSVYQLDKKLTGICNDGTGRYIFTSVTKKS